MKERRKGVDKKEGRVQGRERGRKRKKGKKEAGERERDGGRDKGREERNCMNYTEFVVFILLLYLHD